MFILSSCTVNTQYSKNLASVLAVESFLADITQNVCGERLKVDSLITEGMDPHSFVPSPRDIIKIKEADIVIINGAGLESWLDNIAPELDKSGISVVEASEGIPGRNNDENDPHFWLSPYLAIDYVKNIRDALILADKAGSEIYNSNAEKYIKKLEELDKWIKEQVEIIPRKDRLLITNHESFGYYADRYGFEMLGTIIPGTSSASSASAKNVAELIDTIKKTKVKAILLESGSDPAIARRIADETGIAVIEGLYTHALTDEDGNAPTYIKLMEYNTRQIVQALK